MAKTQEKINKMTSSVSGAADSLSAFDRMEAKANKMLDEANAMAELNSKEASADQSVEDLMKAYDEQPSANVDDELAALKAQLGK